MPVTTTKTRQVADSNITYQKVQNITAQNKLLGRYSSGAGITEEIGIGAGLSISGSSLIANISGTTNYIPKFTSANAIGNSIIYDDGTNIGIGIAVPLHLLHLKATSPTLNFEKTSVLNWTIGNLSGNDFGITADNIVGTAFSIASNTGVATFLNNVTSGGTYTSTASSGEIYRNVVAGTGAKTFRLASTGADAYWGIESSSAGGFFTGSSAYATVLYSSTEQQFIVNNVARLTLAASGSTFSGSLTSNGKLTITSTNEVARYISTNNVLYIGYRANGVDVGYLGNGVGLVSGGSATDFGIRAENNLIFTILNSTKAIINSSGNFGIGVNPTNARLEVVATTGEVFRADANGGAYRIVADQTGVNLQGAIVAAGSLLVNNNAITQDGTRPIFTLQQSSVTKLILGISSGASDIIVGDASGDVDFRTNSQAFNFSVDNGSSIAFKITSGANVNIGASLGSDRRFSIRGQGTTSSTYTAEFANSSGGTIFLLRDDGVAFIDDRLVINSFTDNGTDKLQVNGFSRFNDTAYFGSTTQGVVTWGASAFQFRSFASNDIAFYNTAGTDLMRIKDGGNVGIGNASPSYKLDVTGVIRATSDIRAEGKVYIGTNGAYIEEVAIDGVYELRVVDSAGNTTVIS